MEEIEKINYELEDINVNLSNLNGIKDIINTLKYYIHEDELLEIALSQNIEKINKDLNKNARLSKLYENVLPILGALCIVMSITSIPLSLTFGIFTIVCLFRNKNTKKVCELMQKDYVTTRKDLIDITASIVDLQKRLDNYLSKYPNIEEDIEIKSKDKSKLESKKRFLEYNYKGNIDNILSFDMEMKRI